MNNDDKIELDILAAGVKAPRVTPDQINTLFFKVNFKLEQPKDQTATFCHAYLPGKNDNNWYLGTGTSACVSPENYDAEIGKTIATNKAQQIAKDKLWELEGYALFKELNK